MGSAISTGEYKRQLAAELLRKRRASAPKQYPLSIAQERLWFLEQLKPGNSAYHIPCLVRLSGSLSVSALESALNKVIERHSILRTRFKIRDGSPVQEVSAQAELRLAVADLEAGVEPDLLAIRHMSEETHRPFALDEAPLLRVKLLRRDPQEHYLLLCMHHIVSDGWSSGIFVRELLHLYDCHVTGTQPQLASLDVQYADYAVWQRNWLQGERLEQQLDYWKKQLGGIEALQVPEDYARPATVTYRGGWHRFTIPNGIAERLVLLTRERRLTLFIALLAALQVMLKRYTGQDDVSIGTPIANRNRPELEPLIGFLVNTVVLRTQLDSDPSFDEVLQRARETLLGAHAHQDLPFEKLVEGRERDLSRNPLFQVALSVQGPLLQNAKAHGLAVEELNPELGGAKFDLSFVFTADDTSLSGEIEYAADLFAPETIKRMARHFVRVLDHATGRPEQPISTIPLITPEERVTLVEQWAAFEQPVRAATLPELLYEQARKTPDAIAISDGSKALTYKEATERSNQLAHLLRAIGVGPEVRVVVCLDRSTRLVWTLLAVMKAGGVYVPFDPDYPQDRLDTMLTDANPAVLITTSTLAERFRSFDVAILDLDREQARLDAMSDDALPVDITPNNAAYMLYTSGSTGRPKGVVIEHRCTVALLEWALQVYSRRELEAVLFSTSVCFDLSVFELLVPLVCGGRVVVVPNLLESNGVPVTLINSVPSVVAEWLRGQGAQTLPPVLNLAGEPFPKWLAERLHAASGNSRVMNLYGPTECTTYSTFAQVDPQQTPNIGRPIYNTRAYVLDEWQQPAPVGIAGELYIGGAGVGRGYWQRSALTAERFVPDPFSLDPGKRLYRTGDLVRWRNDGTLEYVGRMDFQVKLHGYRIELGEIESALCKHPLVEQAAVVLREDTPGNPQLAGYFILRDGLQTVPVEALRTFVGEQLPGYMVPSSLTVLAEFPHSSNGKLQRHLLPAPETKRAIYAAPRNEAEQILSGIFAEVLGVERVSIESNFFELGGHSLLATQVTSRIKNAMNIDLPLRVLFERPSVRSLSEGIRSSLLDPVASSDEDVLPLSHAQQRLWFIDQLAPGTPAHNISLSVRLSGELSVQTIERALRELMVRHEILQTSFPARDGKPVLQTAPEASPEFAFLDFAELPDDQTESVVAAKLRKERQRPFNLAHGPLFRAVLARRGNRDHDLLLCTHETVCDAWSLGLLLRELVEIYHAIQSSTPLPVKNASIRFSDYAAWQRDHLTSDLFEKELRYWRVQLAGLKPLELPALQVRNSIVRSSARREFAIPQDLITRLTRLSRSEGSSVFIMLLAAIQAVMCRYSGQRDIAVGLITPNRHRAEVESVIGPVANTLVLRTDLAGDPQMKDVLARVRSTLLDAYAHQEIPYEMLVEDLDPVRELGREALFQVMCSWTDLAGEPIEAGEITVSKHEMTLGEGHSYLAFHFVADDKVANGTVEYACDLFDLSGIDSLIQSFLQILSQLPEHLNRRLSEVEVMPVDEIEDLQRRCVNPRVPIATEQSVVQLFEQQVALSPDAIAVRIEDEQLTFSELNERANQLARLLTRHLADAGPEPRIGFCLDRGPELIIAILGILKAGGVYVPLDPAYPVERLQFIATDSRLRLILTQARLKERMGSCSSEVLTLEDIREELTSQNRSNPPCRIDPDNLAYIMYTSGSTGKPKGVGIPHRGIIRLVRNPDYVLLDRPVILQLAPVAFDASTFEIWGSLLNQGQLVLCPSATPSLEEIAQTIQRQSITTLWLTAGLFHRMAEEHPSALGQLQQLLAGGDALLPSVVEKMLREYGTCQLINGYGPTENTTFSCCCRLNPAVTRQGTTPIGVPVRGSSAYVLDEWLQVVPIGVAGELYVGGEGLARGYIGESQLTAERFVPNPFGTSPGERLYRTQDRARWLPDGNLEFLGRLDSQVKIRGFRVEPGEVEAVLAHHPQVSHAAVVARENIPGDKRLVAYIVHGAGARLTPQEWRDYVLSKLPEYLCPSTFVLLDELPLTTNGKVDRRALPAPDWQASGPYVAPKNLEEEMLCGIWESLLRIERVGVHDNFFELGGHSMVATQVISRIRRRFGIEAPLRLLFEAPTVAQLVVELNEIRSRCRVETPSILSVNRQLDLPLSSAQNRLWFIEQLGPGTALYNMPFALRIRGDLQINVLERTLSEIIRRHEVLRTCYPSHNGEPVQRILPSWDIPLPVSDLSGMLPELREQTALDLIGEEGGRGFDLEQGPVLYFRLLRLAGDDHVLTIAIHHIAGDGWSMGVLTKELASLYEAFSANVPSPLSEPPIQYGDFSVWQRDWLSGPVLDEQLEYWREQLAGVPVLDLPTDHPRPLIPTHRGATHPFRISPQLTARLRSLGHQQGATLFMTLLAAFNVLLSRYSRQRDVAVGSVIANRNRAEIEELIGFFVNTLVLRTDLSGEPSFLELLGRVRTTALDAYARQDIPFERLVQELEPNRDLSRQPLFQVMFVLQNTPREHLRLGSLSVSEMGVPQTDAKFDLSLTLVEVGDALEGEIDYSLDLFDETTIAQMAAVYVRILNEAVQHTHDSVFALRLLGEPERQSILQGSAGGNRPVLAAGCLHTHFAQRAQQDPAAVAVVCGDQTLSYGDLQDRADRLAAKLVAMGVREESLIAICLDRSVEMIVAILAVLHAGGAYVPLDPDYPQARLDFALRDTGAAVLVTTGALRHRLQAGNTAILEIDAPAARVPTGIGLPHLKPENAAYVIYTSGSTGQPKGVVVTHGNVLRLFQATEEQFRFSSNDVWSLFHSYAFDFSVWEIWGALLYGGKLVIVSRTESRSPELFHSLLVRHQVTILNQTPSAFLQLQQADQESTPVQTVRAIIFGGEALDPSLVSPWFRNHPECRMINMYGITETTVHTSYKLLTATDVDVFGHSPIGRALADLELYVLDEWLELVPEGVVGEIYVGGAGLARGYFARPDLTASRFIPHPFAAEPGLRLYRTGDLARYHSAGMEYRGRADEQVKLRGFRIELGEIEAALRSCPGVRETAVIVREDNNGQQELVAYLTATDGEDLSTKTLRMALSSTLPEYMIPGAFVYLDRLPLTANGKLDRKLLAKPERGGDELFTAAQTPTQEILSGIWQAVLGTERVGIDANFFEIGGHSLLATQVLSRVRKAFDVDVPLRLLFERSTIRQFSQGIEQAARTPNSVPRIDLRPALRSAKMPVSYAQQRLWLVEQLIPGTSAYHIAGTVRLSGNLDIDALQRSFREIVRRHESLRTIFLSQDGQPVQKIEDNVRFEPTVVDVSDAADPDATAQALLWDEAQRAFDLADDLLFRVTLVRLAQSEFRLLVTMHHLISDGWSIGVLMREFGLLYRAFSRGKTALLPELPIQYADYAVWQRSSLNEQSIEEHLVYWRKQLEGVDYLELPTDFPRPAVADYRGGWKNFRVGRELTTSLKKLSQAHGCTLFMTLLAALQVTLARYTGRDDIAVGSPVAGRELPELEPLIGFFVNTLVLRADLRGNPTMSEFLVRLRKTVLDAYAHQTLPFEKTVEVLQPDRDLARQPLFQVVFALQNVPTEELHLEQLRISSIETLSAAAKFDLSVMLSEDENGLSGEIEYAAELFLPETIERLIEHYSRVLTQMADTPDVSLSGLRLMADDQWAHELALGEGVVADYPQGCVHTLFERQAASTPNAPAVLCGSQQLSYADLDARATALSRRLCVLGAGPERSVGLYLERSPALIVAMLATLKVGGVYVPLDHQSPPDRLAFMIADTGLNLILTDSRLRAELPPVAAQIVEVDAEGEGKDLAPHTSLDSAAYVNYTSGSTGVPKGVVVSHRNIVRLVCNTDFIQFRGSERVAHAANIAFDAATFEIWGPLLHGAAICILPFDVVADAERLGKQLIHDRITTMFVTTALFNRLVDQCPQALAGLETLLFGGEAVDTQRVETLVNTFRGRLLHVYGPTETTTFAAWHPVHREPYARTVPIGKPIANTSAYVLDPWLDIVPPGLSGELYLAGSGLARGYRNRPDLTAERFIPNPFASVPGERLYRTGDIVRRSVDGQISFVGRRDNQVKIRGFRIELGEIEAALLSHPDIAQAVVSVHTHAPGDKRLIAYFTSCQGASLTVASLRNFLKQHVPEYMVPQAFAHLESLPLTPTGKIDRRKLPMLEVVSDGPRAFKPAMNAAEEILLGIWQTVLGSHVIGTDDNFFELGGHSLLATQVVSRARAAFGLDLPLRLLFEQPTIESFAREIETRSGGNKSDGPPIAKAIHEEPYPLSFGQQRMWFTDQWEPGNTAYNVPAAVGLRGEFSSSALEGALREIVRRHEVLRTRFEVRDGVPVQVVQPCEASWPLVEQVDLRASASAEQEVRRWMREEAGQPFDLAGGRLLRARLLQLAAEEHVLLLTMHHIASDGWSMGVLVSEIGALYNAFRMGEPSPLPELAIQYADYAVWQREHLSGELLETQLAYWQHQLKNVPVLEMPTDFARAAERSYQGASVPVEVEGETLDRLRDLARQQGVTLYMVLLASFQLVLAKWTGQDDIAVGTAIANRTRSEIEGLIGFFVNTLVLRTDLSGDPTVTDLLGRVRETSLGAYAHQDLPFERLVEALNPERSLNRTPLFQAMFTLQNAPFSDIQAGQLQVALLPPEVKAANFDLTLELHEEPGALRGALEYVTDLFSHTTIERVSAQYRRVLEQVASDPSITVSRIALLDEKERWSLIRDSNLPLASHLSGDSLISRFQARVASTPDREAIVFASETLTYRELDERSDRLARRLLLQGVVPEQRVAICLEPSTDLVVSIVAVLKAGAAYVPLDPNYPEDRLRQTIEDAQPAVLISRHHLEERVRGAKAIVPDCSDPIESGDVPESSSVDDSGAAYVIYTSGSTGRPKGVVVTHASVVRLFDATAQWFDFSETDSWILFHSFAFDFSVWELWGALLYGGKLIIPSRIDVRSPETMYALLERHQVTVLNQTPSAFRQLQDVDRRQNRPLAIRYVIFGGEALDPHLVSPWAAAHPACRLINMYGITETTVHTTYKQLSAADMAAGRPSAIGQRLPDLELYVLDQSLEPTPEGVVGEIYIGGPGLARGYLNRPDLTADRFIPHPYSSSPGARLYRSGDLARRGSGEDIDYLGRIDSQVKIRGFRIELGEVEAALRNLHGVRDAVVIAEPVQGGDRDEKQLIAYVIVEPELDGSSGLRAQLRSTLPEHMVPSAFVVLGQLPLTPNGKLDRRALPRPELAPRHVAAKYVPPSTALESVLCAIWLRVLNVERVGVLDDFFELGGHSLSATRVVSQIQELFSVQLPLRRLFEHPTVAGIVTEMLADVTSRQRIEATAELIQEVEEMPEDDIAELLELQEEQQ